MSEYTVTSTGKLADHSRFKWHIRPRGLLWEWEVIEVIDANGISWQAWTGLSLTHSGAESAIYRKLEQVA